LIGPKDGKAILFKTLDQLPAGEMLAMGEPGAVPAGRYAKQALEKLGKWDALAGRVVFGGDVGAVLNYARRGEVAAAIVYRTEVQGLDDVQVFDQASGDWAPTAEVVAAVVKPNHSGKRANAFVDFLLSPAARQLFRDYGFGPP
jgi:molybdate transport system substrate-binding protein